MLDEIQCSDGTAALYEINFAYDLDSDLRRIAMPTLVLEITTPTETRELGRQGDEVCALIPGAISKVMHADGFRLTLEDKAEELSKILREFFAGSPQELP